MSDSELGRLIYMLRVAADELSSATDTGNAMFVRDAARELARLQSTVTEQAATIERFRKAGAEQNEEICQTLGQALGYPWFKDDPKNFPGSDESHGVCVGDHVAETIASEAAETIAELRRERDTLIEAWPEGEDSAEIRRHPDGWYIASTRRIKGIQHHTTAETKREAVRFAAGLGEEGENVP